MKHGAAAVPCPLAVVMPSRNQAAFIAQAIDSVFAQGVAGLQLFVQDGDSTDGTPVLLAELALRHPGLHWTSEPDAGPADALNRAFARALTETDAPVLGWLNSDDLYTPGAAQRALAHLQRHPEQVLVYGEGEHVDAQGAPLGRYPTRGPDTPLRDWADGCPLCQPTVFLRRAALLALPATPSGGAPLDTGLRTAFDYELWLRLWKTFPGRMGQVAAVQAQSRLHEQGITLSMREQVALEGLQVIRRHLGPAPAHWLLTHFHEVMAAWPARPAQVPPGEAPQLHLLRLVERAQPCLSAEAAASLRRAVADHAGWRLATAQAVLDVHADGWAGASTALRSAGPLPLRLRLNGQHTGAQAQPLQLQLQRVTTEPGTEAGSGSAIEPGTGLARAPGPVGQPLQVPVRAPFSWDLMLPPAADGGVQHWRVLATPIFVPARHEPGSTDERPLSFLLTGLQSLA